MSGRRLVVDAGGTNARFALAESDGTLDQVQTYRAADFPRFMDALQAYLAAPGRRQDLASCAIAAAGPNDSEEIKLTNNAWTIGRAETSAALAGAPVALLNDLEAVAAALPHLTVADFVSIGAAPGRRPERRTMLALNIGTGFGAASAVRHGGKWRTCASEAGHMTLGRVAGDDGLWPDDAIIETLLSGNGVVELYRRLANPGEQAARPVEAADVFALGASDATARRVIAIMTNVFGRIAGDLALATAAWGGVYLCGAVALGWSSVADFGKFRAAFTNKGVMATRMRQIPIAVVHRDNVSLFGLARMAIPTLDL